VTEVIGGVGGLSVYITQNTGRSAYLPIVTVTFWCSGDVLKRCYCSFGCSPCEVIAPYVCVSSYFV
jgi:hypothetical protein